MEEVLRSGTAAGVRARYGFTVPAAGKTGTSDHDGWFAGYTSELFCVVWVGFDDNAQLDIEGAKSAAPIWGEFMKRALEYREYRDAKPFAAPDGIISMVIDPQSGMPATANCPKTQTEVYIAGTEPVGVCALHRGRGAITNVAGWETPADESAAAGQTAAGQTAPSSVAHRAARQAPLAQNPAPPPAPQQQPKPPEKKGILRRLLNVFK